MTTASKLLMILSVILWGRHAYGQAQQSWLVQPSTCIVASLGDICEMHLNISISNLATGQYCYYQDEVKLLCWQSSSPVSEITVRFTQPTTIALKTMQGETVLHHEIDLKAREIVRKTRRVRQPWSLF